MLDCCGNFKGVLRPKHGYHLYVMLLANITGFSILVRAYNVKSVSGPAIMKI